MSDCLDYSEDHSSAHHPPKSSPQVGSTQSEPDYQIETTNRIQSLDQEQEANSSVWCLGDRDVRSRRKFSGPLLKWKSRRSFLLL